MARARTTDGVAIAFEAVGEGPPDVIFLHGYAGSRRYFEETIGHLDLTRLRAIALDLRGHGDSEEPANGRYALDDLAGDVLAVADEAGAERFVLVGFSISGKFAQYVSCLHPERVLGQILVAGTTAAELPMPTELLDDWFARAGSAEAMVDMLRPYLTRPVAEPLVERFGQEAARAPRAALEGTTNAVTSTNFSDRLGASPVPTLVIGGRRDEFFTPEVLRDGVAGPLGARLVLLDCGHEVPLEQPLELAALIESFLAGLGS